MLQQRDAHALQQRDARALQRNDAQALDAALQQQQRAPLQPRNASDTTPQASPRAEKAYATPIQFVPPAAPAGAAASSPSSANTTPATVYCPTPGATPAAASPRPSPRRFFGSPRPAPPVYRQSPRSSRVRVAAARAASAAVARAAVAAGVAELRTTPMGVGGVGARLTTPVEADTCSICLEALDATDKTLHTIRKCGHRFHLDCISRAVGAKCTTCPLCRSLISPGLTPCHNRFGFAPARGYSPLDLRSDIRGAAQRARDAMRTRMAALEAAREEEPPTPATPPLRFTLTDDDPVF
ncbi:hypothetical protein JL720_1236 [Aureococcus anophagefferens]|nr:hypothetical protein JL720_1236 [Aureococcus anophagefferens]